MGTAEAFKTDIRLALVIFRTKHIAKISGFRTIPKQQGYQLWMGTAEAFKADIRLALVMFRTKHINPNSGFRTIPKRDGYQPPAEHGSHHLSRFICKHRGPITHFRRWGCRLRGRTLGLVHHYCSCAKGALVRCMYGSRTVRGPSWGRSARGTRKSTEECPRPPQSTR